MSAYTDPLGNEAKLANYAGNADQIHFVSDVATPTDISNSIGFVTVTKGDGNGAWTITSSGNDRDLELSQQDITTDSLGGIARHVVAWDSTNSRVKIAWETTEAVEMSGNRTYRLNALSVSDPAATVG